MSKPPEASSPPASTTSGGANDHGSGRGTNNARFMLAFGALGVVYGDIGTSVLYAVKECFHHAYGLDPSFENVLGLMSLFFWSLLLVVVLKYLSFVMEADNRGEGGILALLALVTPKVMLGQPSRRAKSLMYLGGIGASLLAADGTITPAISVLSAVEGLEVATPAFKPAVVPITIVVLLTLFWVQRRGTAKIAAVFSPAMVVWFLAIGISAIPAIVAEPRIFLALNPYYGIKLLYTHGLHGFLVLGSVVLCLTGAEALYADMGHFGRGPIRLAWYGLVMPSLLLNYFGQGALIIAKGSEVINNPFFALAPSWGIYPMVALATMATVIASQALISGSFSLAQQAIQLGYCPRLTVIHTSEETKGQIFIPEVNAMLVCACILLVLMFRSSSNLAAAYGVSVMGAMIITSFMMYSVMVKRWRWARWKGLALTSLFLAVDTPFLLANLPKVLDGGWFPLLVCAVVFMVMTTWKRGRTALVKRLKEQHFAVQDFVDKIRNDQPYRSPGTAIFMTGNVRSTPPALRHHYAHNRVLHEKIVMLSIVTSDIPTVAREDVLEVESLGEGFYEVIANYGFMQTPKVSDILRELRARHGLKINEDQTTYFLGRDVLLTNGPERMANWRKTLFSFLTRNSISATAYFGIPPNRVVELGMQVAL